MFAIRGRGPCDTDVQHKASNFLDMRSIPMIPIRRPLHTREALQRSPQLYPPHVSSINCSPGFLGKARGGKSSLSRCYLAVSMDRTRDLFRERNHAIFDKSLGQRTFFAQAWMVLLYVKQLGDTPARVISFNTQSAASRFPPRAQAVT